MGKLEKSTLELVHATAKVEFMEKGVQAASLRNIVKTASMTTGAFYGYYDSKEELFPALVDEATVSLVVENETLMQESLSRLIENKTVMIIVLSDDMVAEQGSSGMLLKKNSVYVHMVRNCRKISAQIAQDISSRL